MEPPDQSKSLFWSHPNTKNIGMTVSDIKVRMALATEYRAALGETSKNLHALQAGISSYELINQMLLPEEQYSKTNELYAVMIQKVDNKTDNEYETRFGVNLMLTNKRLILTDVDRNDTPLLINKKDPNNREEINRYRVGHTIGESLMYQPVNYSSIYSVMLDISNTSEASRELVQRRNMLMVYAGIIIALAGILWEYFIILGALVALAGYAFLKTMSAENPIINMNQFRGIRIGLIDPLSLRRSTWKVMLDHSVPPQVLIDWASKLQAEIVEKHGDVQPSSIFEL